MIINNNPFLNTISPVNRNDQLFNAFIQDEITLIDDTLWFTIGSKFEHNDYSGFEVQPTAKLMWTPHHHHRLWGAVSKAVRTPSRLEHNINILSRVIPPTPSPTPPVAITFKGDTQYDSEQVISYELGYRTTIIDNLSIDITAFYNDYSNLRSIQTSTLDISNLPAFAESENTFINNIKAQTYGLEIATVWQMLDWWRWDVNYSLLKTHFDGGVAMENIIGFSPQQRVSVRSAMSPWQNIDLDILFRYVDKNKAVGFFGYTVINDYVSMDIRLAWRPINDIELSLVGQNLLASQHLEYRQEAFTTPTEIDRGFYGKLAWHF